MPESDEPPYFLQIAFTVAFILGNLMWFPALALSLGARFSRADLLLVCGLRVGVIALLLLSVLLARKMWKIKRLIPEGPLSILQVVLTIAYFEIGFALLGIITIAIRQF